MKFNLLILQLCLIVLQIDLSGAIVSPVDEFNNDSDRQIYENALLQVQFLIENTPSADSLFFDLMHDAEDLAGSENFRDAYFILKTILELSQENIAASDSPGQANYPSVYSTNGKVPSEVIFQSEVGSAGIPQISPQINFQLETGVDYSLQEFEMSFIETDSTISEELRNPYFGMMLFHPLRILDNPMELNHRFRVDKQFLNYQLAIRSEQRRRNWMQRMELNSNYFQTRSDFSASFVENRLQYLFGNYYGLPGRWYTSVQGRYKWYPQPDSISSDIYSVTLTGFYEYDFNLNSLIYLNFIPEFYKESRQLGLNYYQVKVNGFYRYRKSLNKYFEIGMETVYRDFRTYLGTESYPNSYISLFPQMNFEIPLGTLGFNARIGFEKRSYRNPNEINPDFNSLQVEVIQKIYWSDFNSFGIGYRYAQEWHLPGEETVFNTVAEEDFYSNGLVVTAEMMNLSGILINLEYQVNWRNYPNAQNSLFPSFYSNRLIHSIHLLGWIPFSRHWQIQVFANYDNDTDRSIDHNNNQNTIINLGLNYNF